MLLLKPEKVDIEAKKVDIESEKVDIEAEKVDIESLLSAKMINFTAGTKTHIHKLFKQFGLDTIFGRSAIVKLLSLQNSSASKLISKLLQAEIIERVAGYGKGKYKFKK